MTISRNLDRAVRSGDLSTLASRLLSGTALALSMATFAGSASAQSTWSTSLIPGIPGPTTFSTPISIADVVFNTVNVGSTVTGPITTNGVFAGTSAFNVASGGTVNSVAWGLWGVSGSQMTATIDGAVNAATNGVTLNTQLGAGTRAITVGGTGTVTGTSGYGLWLVTDTGNIQVAGLNGGITSGLSAIFATSTTGAILADGLGVSTLTSTAVDGATLVTSGNATVQNFATVTGARNGIYVIGSAGTTSIQGNGLVGGINGTNLNGIVIGPSSGNVNIGTVATNGVITAAANGIWVNNSGAGNNTIVQNNNVTGGNAFYGMITDTGTGTTSITATAATQGGTGIRAASTTGAITLDGKGTGTLTGNTLDGATLVTQGAATVQNFATVTGDRNGIYVLGSAGTTNVQGNALVGGITGTAGNGIVVGPSTGDVNIGTTATNGVITGGTNGIWVNNTLAGNTSIVTDKNVTGSLSGGWGILSTTLNGNNTIAVNAGTIRGNAALEVTTVGSGNVATTIAAGAIVDGTTWGYVTTTGTGVGVTNNAGLIKTTADTGAAGIAGSGLAVLVKAGTNVVNNTSGGNIIGGFTTGGIANTLNNNAGAVWTPSLANSFGAITDTANNAGLINIRSGNTVFAGLEALNNQAGGVINMQYGAASTDTLTVLNFMPKAGSALNVNVETGAANGAGDTGGQGRADTVLVVGTSTPQAASTINLLNAGPTQTTLTGSIAIVNTTAADVLAPTPGAALMASTLYSLGAHNLPGFGAKYKYTLVDDGAGGVFLVWQPNLTAATLGGYGGALGASGGAASGSAINGAAGSSAGVGGVGFGGGPTGGGVAGRIGDMAASSVLGSGSAMQVGQGGMKDGASAAAAVACQRRQAWGQVEGERTRSDGGGTGQSQSLSGGVEFDVGEQVGLGCNRFAFGTFAFGSAARNAASGSSSNTDTTGIGAYARLGSATGLYATVLGAANWSDSSLVNAAFASTAEKDSKGLTGSASLGYLARVAPSTAIDVRGFVSYNNNKGDPFTDSVGIEVSETKDNIRTYGASIGLHQAFTPSLQGFIRGGVKWSNLDSSVTSFGVKIDGSAKGTATSVEAGLVGNVGNGIQLGASGFGTFSEGTKGYGAKAHVGVKF
jgi:hypothetical protein